jgi:hypothetical protein
MANRNSGKRRSGIIALIAVIAALAGAQSAAAAGLGFGFGASFSDEPGIVASWAEE